MHTFKYIMEILNYPMLKKPLFFTFETRPSLRPLGKNDLSDLVLSNYNIPRTLDEYVGPLTRGITKSINNVAPQGRQRRISITITVLTRRKDGDSVRYSLYYQRVTDGRDRAAPIVSSRDDIRSRVIHWLNKAMDKISESKQEASGWEIVGFPKIDTRTGVYSPAAGMGWRPLPEVLHSYIRKKRLVNIENNDNQCFKWCIIAHVSPSARNPTRIGPYKKAYEMNPNAIDFSGLTYPVKVEDIPAFSAMNPHLPPIIVYNISDNLTKEMVDSGHAFIPVQVPQNIAPNEEPIGLILHREHYILAREPRLLAVHRPKKARNFICYRHNQTFSSKERYDDHMTRCADENQICVNLPDKDYSIKFGTKADNQKMIMSPYTCYADLETLTGDSSAVVSSFAFNIVADHKDADHQGLMTFKGVGCLYRGLEKLSMLATAIQKEVEREKEQIITPAEEVEFKTCKHCWICKKDLGEDRVKDFHALSGKYRGALHKECADKQSLSKWKLPVWFHNGRGFDFHYIAPLLPQISRKFDVISMTFEKITTITTDNMVFRDSNLHMGTTLEKWAKETGELPHTKAYFENVYCSDVAELITKKGEYPYEWVDSWDKFEATELPPREAFASKLAGKGAISEERYQHAQTVWNAAGCLTFQDYNDVYLEADVTLLTDCMESYRAKAMQEYGLDPVHFCTAPSLAWTACLKKTGAEIKPFVCSQKDMLLFAEATRRGGMVNAITRHVETGPYDDVKYIDANNLYGWAMTQKLPTGDYEWETTASYEGMAPEELETAILGIPTDGKKGYIFEVDIHCPKSCHDKFNDLPLFPEAKVGTPSTFIRREYPAEIRPPEMRTPKLIADLEPKKDYGTHLKMLQFAIRHGYRVTKVNRIMSFAQESWIADYINFNTEQRNECKKKGDSVGSALFKLLNNAFFGKTCENVRKRANISTVSNGDDRKLERQFSHPLTKTWRHFIPLDDEYGEGYTAFAKQKTRVTIDKPILVGVCILELSKLLMYEAWYDTIQALNPSASLIYMDTDSFIVGLKGTEEKPAKFDFGKIMDKNIIGLFKDECGGARISEVVALRAKTYSVLIDDQPGMLKAKGVPSKASFKETGGNLCHKHYLDAVEQRKVPDVCYNTFQSTNHLVTMKTVTKKSLSAYDDKRWVLDDGLQTLAHGHYKIARKLAQLV